MTFFSAMVISVAAEELALSAAEWAALGRILPVAGGLPGRVLRLRMGRGVPALLGRCTHAHESFRWEGNARAGPDLRARRGAPGFRDSQRPRLR
jgi:hypothetical protein